MWSSPALRMRLGRGDAMTRKFAVLGALLLFDASAAHADDCDELAAARIKLNRAPFREETTISAQSGPGKIGIAIKKIFTGDMLYEFRNDEWKKTQTTSEKLDEAVRNGGQHFQETCRIDGIESLNGEDADIVAAHAVSVTSVANATVFNDSRYWISRKSNLPLKAEHTTSIVSSTYATTLTYTTIYAYDNVKAPIE
jgi:hypothetical protein